MEKTKIPQRPINHVLDIFGALKINVNELETAIPVLYEVASRQYPTDQLWRIKELPDERYRVLYMLSTGDVMDLSLRYHHMTKTHKIGSSIFELKELESAYKINTKEDTYKTFQEKIKPFVLVEKLLVNPKTKQAFLPEKEEERVLVKIPYDQFRQHFFTIGNTHPISKITNFFPLKKD